MGHELFKFSEATRLPGRDSDSYAFGGNTKLLSFCVRLLHGTPCVGRQYNVSVIFG